MEMKFFVIDEETMVFYDYRTKAFYILEKNK